jgi:hypothetical protein
MIIGGGIDVQNNNEGSSQFIRRMGLFGEINKKEGWSKWFYVESGGGGRFVTGGGAWGGVGMSGEFGILPYDFTKDFFGVWGGIVIWGVFRVDGRRPTC